MRAILSTAYITVPESGKFSMTLFLDPITAISELSSTRRTSGGLSTDQRVFEEGANCCCYCGFVLLKNDNVQR